VPAPFDGIVVRHRVDPGAFVSPGTPLMDIRSLGGVEIVAPIPESEMDRVADGTAEFQIENAPWRGATLLRLEGMTDFATRTRVARFRPKHAAEAPLVPGSFARVRLAPRHALTTPHEPGEAADNTSRMLTVPSRCLVRRGSLTGVYVIREGRAVLRWLRLGRESAEWVEVLAGLASGDEIATEPGSLSDGQRVQSSR
jgi:multidrug efflux pump subunit AcrA (membrane-fusion protein)